MKAALSLIAILIGFGLSSHAAAADSATEEARQHFLKGQQLFDVGRWDEAAAEFEQAYAARSDPTFIYNMAQAYRRKGDAKRALDLYKNYLIKAPKSPLRAEVEERIAALQKHVEEAERAARTAAPVPAADPAPDGAQASAPAAVPDLPPIPAPDLAPAPALAVAPAPVSATPPVPFPAPAYAPSPAPTYAPVPAPVPAMAPAPVYTPLPTAAAAPAYVTSPAPTSPSSSSPGKGLRVGGILCGATGVALIGAGIFFGVEAKAYAHTVEDGSIFNPSFDDRGKLYENLQWVGYGLGGGLVVTGAVLYGFGMSAARSSAVALVPAVVPGGAGFIARGTY